MKSINELRNENRKELVKFLNKIGSPTTSRFYAFAYYNKDNGKWYKDWTFDNEPVNVCDVVPFVLYSVQEIGYNGCYDEIKKFAVTKVYLEMKRIGGLYSNLFSERLMVTLVDIDHPKTEYDVKMSELYGISDCNIYQKMIELNLVEKS